MGEPQKNSRRTTLNQQKNLTQYTKRTMPKIAEEPRQKYQENNVKITGRITPKIVGENTPKLVSKPWEDHSKNTGRYQK